MLNTHRKIHNQAQVLISRKDYEQFLVLKKIFKFKEVSMSADEKKALIRSRKNYAQKKYHTLKQVKHALGIKD